MYQILLYQLVRRRRYIARCCGSPLLWQNKIIIAPNHPCSSDPLPDMSCDDCSISIEHACIFLSSAKSAKYHFFPFGSCPNVFIWDGFTPRYMCPYTHYIRKYAMTTLPRTSHTLAPCPCNSALSWVIWTLLSVLSFSSGLVQTFFHLLHQCVLWWHIVVWIEVLNCDEFYLLTTSSLAIHYVLCAGYSSEALLCQFAFVFPRVLSQFICLLRFGRYSISSGLYALD